MIFPNDLYYKLTELNIKIEFELKYWYRKRLNRNSHKKYVYIENWIKQ